MAREQMMSQQTLSEREKQVAAHLAAGLRVAGVAGELGLAENTVRNHLKHIFWKLDVHSQSQLIAFLRESPSTVSPYHVIARLSNGPDASLLEEIREVDRAMEQRLEECKATAVGLEGMKLIIRAVLPLDDARRKEWRVRLAAHVVAPTQESVRAASQEIAQKWREKPLVRIEDFQLRRWIRRDLDSEEVRRQLFSSIYAAVFAMMVDPSPEEEQRQLAVVDRLLESIAADSEIAE